MKLEISMVLLLCVWATLAKDLMTPILDILGELKKIKTMEERLNSLNDEVRELRSKNEGTVNYYYLTGETRFLFFYSMKRIMKGSSFHLLISFISSLSLFLQKR